MRFRSILFLSAVLVFWGSPLHAQKRVFTTVNPNASVYNASADLYDPATGAFSPVGNAMSLAREDHVAIRLANGKVLLAGGYNNHHLQDAEIYDPSNGSFAATDSMLLTRSGAGAALLPSGGALIAGGYNGLYLSTAEIYEPVTGTFSLVGAAMTVTRQNPVLTRLQSGSILITGGFNAAFLANAEVYDPLNRTFTATGSLRTARTGHTATLLNDGRVLVAGGCNNLQSSEVFCNNFLSSAEIYDPGTRTFTLVQSMATARRGHTATLLPDGRVLISGGVDGAGALASAEIYNPETGLFTATGDMTGVRTGHTAALLPDGKVLIAGGKSDRYLAAGEIYDPAAGTFSPLVSTMSTSRAGHSATVLAGGRVLLAGGRNDDPLVFDVNVQSPSDSIAPNIVFSADSSVGFVPYAGSGTVVAFSPATGEVTGRIETGGQPAWLVPYAGGLRLAAVSVLDNRVFIIDAEARTLAATYSFDGRFGFGSVPAISPDGTTGYISSTETGAVIQFSLATGAELGRLTGLGAPARITLSGDGKTLYVVDTTRNQVTLVDAASMASKAQFNPAPVYPITNFTIFSQVVLSADETLALITSQDSSALSSSVSAAFIFDPATGALVTDDDDDDGDGSTTDNDEDEGDDGIYGVGSLPGYATLLPDGKHWAVLSQNLLSLIPTVHPADDGDASDDQETSGTHYDIVPAPLGSANIVLSADNRYAFYASSTTDRVLQHDLVSGGVVGSYPVGDDPNLSADQTSRLGITPDGRVLAALNLASNELDLLADSAVFRQTKFISQQDRFTGLSLVNLSGVSVDVVITAMNDSGAEFSSSGGDIVNPAIVALPPNGQKAVDLSEIFNLDNDAVNEGYLLIESAAPVVVGHTAAGQIQGNFLEAYIRNMEAVPLYAGFGKLHDWILPEIPQDAGSSAQLTFVNPNYNNAVYEITHYGTDGTEVEKKAAANLGAANRTTRELTDVVSSITRGLVLITGGLDSEKTNRSAELFDSDYLRYYTPLGMPSTPRQGHTSTVLSNGKALIAGGKNGFRILRSSELYTAASQSFAFTPGSMRAERYRHTATALGNGRVLLAGGQNSTSINRTAELYDPVSDRFSYTSGPMNLPRDAHTATRLADGRVLIVGGLDGVAASATAEIYDPATDAFSYTGSLGVPRAFHTAVLLGDGRVLVAGGYNGATLDSAELYDPQSGTFSPAASMTAARSHHTATVLADGTVLVTGGSNSESAPTGGLNTAELYDPSTGLFSATNGQMTAYRSFHTATLLMDDQEGDNDRVLLSGGYGLVESDDVTEVETLAVGDLYSPQTGLFTRISEAMSAPRQAHSAVLLTEGISAGYLRVRSGIGMLSSQVYSNGGARTSVEGIDMDRYVGVTRVVSPRFTLSSGRITFLNVINGNQEQVADVDLILHSTDGEVLATQSRTLSVNAQIKGNLWDIFGNDQGLEGREGWLEVVSTVDQIVGTVSFTDAANRFLAAFELSGHPMDRLVYPLVSEDADFYTEISLLNSGEQAADVSLELWGVEGTLKATRAVTLQGGASMSGTLDDWFPGMGGLISGNVRVRSSLPLHAMGELGDRQLRFISSVPPVALPEP
jgi:deoxycytidylate deaminase